MKKEWCETMVVRSVAVENDSHTQHDPSFSSTSTQVEHDGESREMEHGEELLNVDQDIVVKLDHADLGQTSFLEEDLEEGTLEASLRGSDGEEEEEQGEVLDEE